MNYKNLLVFLAAGFGLLSSCEINHPIFVPDDISYVAFSHSETAIRENKGEVDIELYLTTYSSSPAEFTLTSYSEGLEYPAIEGTDYHLPAGSKVSFPNGMGYAEVSVDIIDNDEKDGLKQFWLEIESGTEDYQIGIDGKHKILITIQDDEHPLKYILGRYRIEAVSYYGSQYNLAHEGFLIEPDADTTKVRLTNIVEGVTPTLSRPLIGTVDVLKQEITVKSGQQWSNPKTNGYYFSFYKGDPENANDQGPEPLDEAFILSWAGSGSDITITGFDNWGPKWMEPSGAFDSWWWWDFYTSAILTKVEDY
ncbi:MAG: hypothetical protein JW973_12285 [Bacteroidales bacterium]|nr:hypothetical protein [Bacteroidales bacterium]